MDACNTHFAINFFFQAEDGIRDLIVTGVQTCALPILRSAPSWRRVSAVCARALSRSTELCASVRSRRKPSKSVHDSAKLRRFKLRFPPSNPCHGSFSPWLEVLYDAVSLGKYCERLDQSVAAVARSDAAACITAGAWRSATVRSSVVSGTGGSCEAGIARTTPSTPIC